MYACGKKYFVICHKGKPEIDNKIDVHGFVDIDWVSDPNHRWSTSGYLFKLFGGVVSWMSRR